MTAAVTVGLGSMVMENIISKCDSNYFSIILKMYTQILNVLQ